MSEEELDTVQIVGGWYVGCRVRVAEGTWETGACKEPVYGFVPINDFEYIVVCAKHLAQFKQPNELLS